MKHAMGLIWAGVRRVGRFRLRTLLAIVTLSAIVFGRYVEEWRDEARGMRALEASAAYFKTRPLATAYFEEGWLGTLDDIVRGPKVAVTDLYFQGSAINDETLAELPDLGHVERLTLYDTRVTDHGTAALELGERLGILFIARNELLRRFPREAAAAWRGLKWLLVADCPVFAEDLAAIAELPVLEELVINDARFSLADFREFTGRRALKKLLVHGEGVRLATADGRQLEPWGTPFWKTRHYEAGLLICVRSRVGYPALRRRPAALFPEIGFPILPCVAEDLDPTFVPYAREPRAFVRQAVAWSRYDVRHIYYGCGFPIWSAAARPLASPGNDLRAIPSWEPDNVVRHTVGGREIEFVDDEANSIHGAAAALIENRRAAP